MGASSFFTFVLIALSCYALCNTKPQRSEHQATSKKVDLPNDISSEPAAIQRISHAIKNEARQKRSQRDQAEYRDLNDIIEDLEENGGESGAAAQAAASPQPQELDFENMPPLTYYLLLQKLRQLQANEPTYRVRTPRLGRSIDFQLMDAADRGGDGGDEGGLSRKFMSRVIKKSVPFKPRLGKRGQTCE